MTVIFPPRYLAPVSYYAVMYAAMTAGHNIVIDTGTRYDKRCKAVHRAVIADTHGELRLTVPVSRDPQAAPGTRPLWSDRMVSAHGRWWDIHRIALESSYGRTPYFQYYIDRLLPWISEQSVGMRVTDLDCGLDREIRAMLHMRGNVNYVPDNTDSSGQTVDYRHIGEPDTVPYWQVRSTQFGFMPGLSILDLLFGTGPEAQIILQRMADSVRLD